jgi:hypothetical protein
MGKYQQQKNIISQQNIQLIEQIGEGEFGTGNVEIFFEIKKNYFFLFNYFLVFKAFWRTKQNELVRLNIKSYFQN